MFRTFTTNKFSLNDLGNLAHADATMLAVAKEFNGILAQYNLQVRWNNVADRFDNPLREVGSFQLHEYVKENAT